MLFMQHLLDQMMTGELLVYGLIYLIVNTICTLCFLCVLYLQLTTGSSGTGCMQPSSSSAYS